MWLLNNLAFNAIWFAAIFFQNLALPFGIFLLSLHCWYFNQHSEAYTVLRVVVIGTFIDTVLMHLGVFVFDAQGFFIPLWLILIWAAFGATLNHSLTFLKQRKMLTIIVGSFAPPLSYLAGYKFGAVSFGYSMTLTFVVLASIWAPLLYYFTQVSYDKKQSTPA